MDDVRHYNRAPIIEAILDFQIPPLDVEKMALLEDVVRALEGDYPTRVTRRTFDDQPIEKNGFACRSVDGHYVVHVRLDGFAFSRLAPYDTWETFTTEAKRAWDVYAQIIAPKALSEFSVRYINKLKVPLNVPLLRFFNVYPAMPDKDVLFSNIIMWVETAIDHPPSKLRVFMAPGATTAENIEDGHFFMLLDNMFIFTVEDVSNVWRNLGEIRKLKNATFNGQLTDEMKETIS